jgi:hypothetical protein
VTASDISHAVLNLEERIGIRLLNRTTRSVSLTERARCCSHTSIRPSVRSRQCSTR